MTTPSRAPWKTLAGFPEVNPFSLSTYSNPHKQENTMAGQDSGYPGMDDDDEVEGEVLELEDGDLEIEIEDDTPDEDKGKTPMPAEIVEDLEADELEE